MMLGKDKERIAERYMVYTVLIKTFESVLEFISETPLN